MPELCTLLTVKYVADDDSGMYTMGEIHGIPKDDIRLYVESYGAERLLSVLIDMIHETKCVDNEQKLRTSKLEKLNCGLNGRTACNI